MTPEDQLFSVALILLIMGGGFASLLGQRRLIRKLQGVFFTMAATYAMLISVDPAIRAALLAALIPLFLVMLSRMVLSALLGKEAAGVVIGQWALRAVDAVMQIPFAVLRSILDLFR